MLNTDNFKRGTVDLVVLSVLREKDMYGYEIVKAIEEKSGGRFQLPLGTLYPVLYRFLENGYLSDRDEIVNKRLRHNVLLRKDPPYNQGQGRRGPSHKRFLNRQKTAFFDYILYI